MRPEFAPLVAKSARIVGKRVSLGEFAVIEDNVLVDSGDHPGSWISIGQRSKMKTGVIAKSYDGFIGIGNRVSVGEYSILSGHGGLIIEDATIIAGHCYISAANHIFSLGELIRFQGEQALGIHIGKGAWIGGCVVIIDGVDIGEGCVVGAGSVVTHNLPRNTICFGVPCKVIKSRHSDRPHLAT
jgi:acetyltransferase-like isoleucine patch superfamily enzyme